MGCAFCATARFGLLRNLTAAEIVGQVLAAQAVLRADERITNIVFMGMGEPLANYDAVVRGDRDPHRRLGCRLSRRAASPSRPSAWCRRCSAWCARPVSASRCRSVARPTRSASGSCRSTAATRWRTLMAMCRALPIPQRRRITFEYVMLAGVNDSLDDAARLVQLAARHSRQGQSDPVQSVSRSGLRVLAAAGRRAIPGTTPGARRPRHHPPQPRARHPGRLRPAAHCQRAATSDRTRRAARADGAGCRDELR